MLRCLAAAEGSVDLSFAADKGELTRVRVAFLWTGEQEWVLHLKGLNCFVSRKGQRPTAAVQLAEDAAVELLSPTRRPLHDLGVIFAKHHKGAMIYTIGGERVSVPRAAALGSVLLDPGSGQECWLVYLPVEPLLPEEEPAQKRRKASG